MFFCAHSFEWNVQNNFSLLVEFIDLGHNVIGKCITFWSSEMLQWCWGDGVKKKNPNDTLKQILKTKDQTLPPSVIVFFCHLPPPTLPTRLPFFFFFFRLFACPFKWASARSTPFQSRRWQRQQSFIQAKLNTTSTKPDLIPATFLAGVAVTFLPVWILPLALCAFPLCHALPSWNDCAQINSYFLWRVAFQPHCFVHVNTQECTSFTGGRCPVWLIENTLARLNYEYKKRC